MAEPLATGSTEDANGYLQQLIVSLKDESSPECVPESPSESAADYVARMVSLANEPLSAPGEYVLSGETFQDSQQDELTGSDTVPLVTSDTDTISWRNLQAETCEDDSEECDEPDPSHASDECVDVADAPLSTANSVAATPTPNIDDDAKPEPPAETPAPKRESISLIPRPTGDASIIARMREVANLTTTDALNAHRSKQLITNAYVAFACAIVSIAIAQFASLFGVDHPGFARLVSHSSLVAGAIATVVYLAMLIGIKRNEAAQLKVARSPSAS